MATKSQILKKEQILSNWIETRQKIISALSELTDSQRDVVFLGVWSVKDLLAHFIGWDHTNRDAIKSLLKSHTPMFYQYRDRDWQTYNKMLVKKYRKDSFEELLTALKASQEKLFRLLQTIPPEHFNKDFGVRFRGYKITTQRLLEAETKDEQVHLEQITGFFKDSK
jgi:hypothetical protein